MPASHPSRQTTNAHDRSGHVIGEGHYTTAKPNNDYYHGIPRVNYSNVLPIPGEPLKGYPKQPWPPSPCVEDEKTSLAREHLSTSSLVTSDDEAQSRGSVDQLPIIQDAEQSGPKPVSEIRNKPVVGEKTSLQSRTSIDSLGPPTPRDPSIDNPDRRYVYIPQEGIEIPLTYDEPRTRPIQKQQKATNDIGLDKSHRKEPPTLGTNAARKPTSNQNSAPLKSAREPSPYAYIANSGRSTFSGDYLLSPDVMTPSLKSSSVPRSNLDRYYDVDHRQRPVGDHDRARSSSSGYWGERPNMGRTASTMAYPGDSQPKNVPPNSRRRVEYPSDESDSDLEDHASFHHRSRGRGHSFVRTDRLGQTSAARQDIPPRRDSGTSASTAPRPTSPISHLPSTFERSFPPQPPGHHGSSLPIRSSTAMGASSNKSLSQTRQMPSYLSPPPSPRPDSPRDGVEYIVPDRRPHPNSRPASPLSFATQSSSRSRPTLPSKSSFGSDRASTTPRSRDNSPLPSPVYERPSSSPRLKEKAVPTKVGKLPPMQPDLSPRPRSRDSSVPVIPAQSAQNLSSRPATDHSWRTHSTADARLQLPLDSQSSRRSLEQPLSPKLKSPASNPPNSIIPPSSSRKAYVLPPCSRPDYVSGYNDWYALKRSPMFDICPSCLEAVTDAGYRDFFTPSPPRLPGSQTKCDFSIPWVRIAWLLIVKQGMPHVNLLHALTNINVNELECPGKTGAPRNWYYLYDADTGRAVSNFDVCPYCVRSLETIFPAVRGIFFPAEIINPNQRRTCDLRSDSRRFAGYIDLIELIVEQQAKYKIPPNMYPFVQMAKKMSLVRECPRDDMMQNWPWQFHPHLPDFTICRECFEEVVRPLDNAGSTLAGQINKRMESLPPPPDGNGRSCYLYSERMRDVFREACKRDDFQMLRSAAMQRFIAERDLKGKLRYLKTLGDGNGVREEIARLTEEWKKWE
ncbi:MAG: hypothetical protein Q9187_005683 [Circinaria calcarea]